MIIHSAYYYFINFFVYLWLFILYNYLFILFCYIRIRLIIILCNNLYKKHILITHFASRRNTWIYYARKKLHVYDLRVHQLVFWHLDETHWTMSWMIGIVEYSILPNGTNTIGQSARLSIITLPLYLFNVIHLSSGTAIGTSEVDAALQILNKFFTKWTVRRKQDCYCYRQNLRDTQTRNLISPNREFNYYGYLIFFF